MKYKLNPKKINNENWSKDQNIKNKKVIKITNKITSWLFTNIDKIE